MNWFLWFLTGMFIWQSVTSLVYTSGYRSKPWSNQTWAVNAIVKTLLALAVMKTGGVI